MLLDLIAVIEPRGVEAEVVLTTERLLLRTVEESDLGAIWAYRSLPDIRTWIGASLDPEQFRERFLEPDDGRRELAVLLDGELIGDLMLVVCTVSSQSASPKSGARPTNLSAFEQSQRRKRRKIGPTTGAEDRISGSRWRWGVSRRRRRG